VGHSILTAIWHMLGHDTEYKELGADFFEKQNLEGLKKAYRKKLERLGFKVTLEPAAAQQWAYFRQRGSAVHAAQETAP
jgi:hypothetical protein